MGPSWHGGRWEVGRRRTLASGGGPVLTGDRRSDRQSFCRQYARPPFTLNIHLFAGFAFFAVLWDGWVDLRSSALSAVSPDERIRVHLCDLWADIGGWSAPYSLQLRGRSGLSRSSVKCRNQLHSHHDVPRRKLCALRQPQELSRHWRETPTDPFKADRWGPRSNRTRSATSEPKANSHSPRNRFP